MKKGHIITAFSCRLIVLPAWLIFVIACKDSDQKTRKNESTSDSSITLVNEWAILPFKKVDSVNPIMSPGTGEFFCPILRRRIKWENKDVFNPAVAIKDGKIYMLYRAEDTIGKHAGTSRIGLAESNDGLHFKRYAEPVFFPANDDQKKYEWEGGCEDPRIVEDESGVYFMTYTAYDGKKARLMVASSRNLREWKKHGPTFAKALEGKYLDNWSKSGSIVSTYENGKIIATRLKGKYWMFWGDVNIWAATSEDLINWTPLEMAAGEKPPTALKYQAATMPDLKIIMGPRQGKFDSDIIEPGPPAMLTDKGILLMYNCRNIPSIGDSSLDEGTYTAAQALIDKNNPTQVLERMNTYFIKPDKDFEINGQVNKVCFVEGMVQFKNKWFLYYGTADSKIAVAVKDIP